MAKKSRSRRPHSATGRKRSHFALKVFVSLVSLAILAGIYWIGNRSLTLTFASLRERFFPSSAPITAQVETAPPTETQPAEETAPVESTASITFDSPELTYDGSAPLNLLEGVHVVNGQGQDLGTEGLVVNIATGDNRTEKTVQYTQKIDGKNVTATRTLSLTNYSGPTITLSGRLTSPTSDNIDDILSNWIEDGLISAEDGFGNDVTDSITATYTDDESNPLTLHYTFSVTNSLADTATQTSDVTLQLTRPLLKLTQDTVYLSVGSNFSYMEYLLCAIDTDGTSLSNRISISSTPDMDTAGTYEVTYSTHNTAGEYADSQTLTVIVQ